MRIVSLGQMVFAVTLIGLGILGLIKGDFTAIWTPVPKGVPAREALAYLCAIVSLACGIALLLRRTTVFAARVLLAYLLFWVVAFRVTGIFREPKVEGSWFNCGETAVLAAAAWILYAWFATDWDRQRLSFASGNSGVRIARTLYGLALIPFGVGHFVYLKETAAFVPGWLPWHVAWAYITGCAFIAAGVAVIIGVFARLAATLSAVQMGLFTLLVWVPIVAAGSREPFVLSETMLSWALTAGAWVVADSYRGTPWLAVKRR